MHKTLSIQIRISEGILELRLKNAIVYINKTQIENIILIIGAHKTNTSFLLWHLIDYASPGNDVYVNSTTIAAARFQPNLKPQSDRK